MGTVRSVNLADIRDNPVALRTVNFESEAFLGLVDSMRQKGFIGAVSGRERTDAETGETYYELIDGLHRVSAARDAGLVSVNMDICEMGDDEVQEAQIMANIHKIETRPVEYTEALKRLLTRNPMMTESELAIKLGKSQTWVANRLSITKITNEAVRSLINEGRINLSNAYALAKLPPEEHSEWTERAITLPPDEFIPAATARAKEIREARRLGKDASQAEFQPVPHVQKLSALKEEVETGAVGKALIERTGTTNAADGFRLGVLWALSIDPASVEVQRAQDEERKRVREEKKAKAKAEKQKAEKAKLEKQLQEVSAAVAAAE